MNFKEVNVKELQFNPFSAIGDQWMLITAGDASGFNTMTASWGGAGVLWHKNTVTCYIRPQRHTKQFVDKNDTFTISFLPHDTYKDALTLCGRVSGKDDPDKAEHAGLTPYFTDGTTAFQEAELIFVCKKIYEDTIDPENILDSEADEKNYAQKDYHTMYIAEIVKAYKAEA